MRTEIKVKQSAHTSHISISSIEDGLDRHLITMTQPGSSSYFFIGDDQLRELIANFQSALDEAMV